MRRLLATTALLCALIPSAYAQSDDPYANKLNAFIQGSRDTYTHARNWQALSEVERDAALHGTTNAISARTIPCSAEATERLRSVCTYYETDTLRTAHLKSNPDYVRGQTAMLRKINRCEALGVDCYAGFVYRPSFGR